MCKDENRKRWKQKIYLNDCVLLPCQLDSGICHGRPGALYVGGVWWHFAYSDRNGAVVVSVEAKLSRNGADGLVNGSVGTVTSLDTRPALPVSSCASSYA